MTETVIPIATGEDRQRALAVLARAFAGDPVSQWLYPDEAAFERQFPRFAEAFAGRAFVHGTADRTADGAGVALWLPPHVRPDGAAMAGIVATTVPWTKQNEISGLMSDAGQHHPRQPHWYLAMMGVEPDDQGRGLGTALARHGLERCERSGEPAYLEASSERSRALYERLGFRVVATVQVASMPALYPMVRDPRP